MNDPGMGVSAVSPFQESPIDLASKKSHHLEFQVLLNKVDAVSPAKLKRTSEAIRSARRPGFHEGSWRIHEDFKA